MEDLKREDQPEEKEDILLNHQNSTNQLLSSTGANSLATFSVPPFSMSLYVILINRA